MFRPNNQLVFNGDSISKIFEQNHTNIVKTIESESEDYILNVNEADYIEHLESQHILQTPEIHFDQVFADSYEADVPAEYFPVRFDVYRGKTYKKQIVQYFIPVSGKINLLKYSPASVISMSGGGDFTIKGDTIVAEFIDFYNDAEEIKRKYQNELNHLYGSYDAIVKDIKNYNNNLKYAITSQLSQRKQKILLKNNLLSNLGVPIRKKDNIASTFAIPKPQLRDKIIINKPTVNEKGFNPEPTLDNENYRKILKLINDVGKNFERMPSVYKDKGEEDLRDHILMTLDPNFEFGSASGETFNKEGKTDIQLRYDSSVIFIAECKFWSGEKKYLATIDQLLGYLTWRDTKASVVVFVKQKDFTTILDKVGNETSNHPNYLGYIDKSDENWFNFRFHINDDRNREVKLAVQLYHLPDYK